MQVVIGFFDIEEGWVVDNGIGDFYIMMYWQVVIDYIIIGYGYFFWCDYEVCVFGLEWCFIVLVVIEWQCFLVFGIDDIGVGIGGFDMCGQCQVGIGFVDKCFGC